MHVEHFEKGVTYNDRELLLLAKKVGRLATYCQRLKDESSSIRVEAERRDTKKTTDETKVMITISLPRKVLRAESRKVTVLEALDSCIDKLEPQIKRYKEVHTGLGQVRAMRHRKG